MSTDAKRFKTSKNDVFNHEDGKTTKVLPVSHIPAGDGAKNGWRI
jgi:hypothetical protein